MSVRHYYVKISLILLIKLFITSCLLASGDGAGEEKALPFNLDAGRVVEHGDTTLFFKMHKNRIVLLFLDQDKEPLYPLYDVSVLLIGNMDAGANNRLFLPLIRMGDDALTAPRLILPPHTFTISVFLIEDSKIVDTINFRYHE